MKSARFALLLAFATAVHGSDVSPVQKVIQLLNDMKAKCQSEKDNEAVEFAKFKQFCKDEQRQKTEEIADQKKLIETLATNIDKYNADIEESQHKIKELHELVDAKEADIKGADAKRKTDKAKYLEKVADEGETVAAIEGGIAKVKKVLGNTDAPAASAALLQLSSNSGLSDMTRETLSSFMELMSQAPAGDAHTYTSHSDAVFETLNLELDKSKKRYQKIQEREMNSRHAYDRMKQDLVDTVEGAKSDISDKTEDMNEKKRLLGEDQKKKALTIKDNEEDEAYLAELKVECEEKAMSFEEKQELRAGEITAIAQATKILQSPDVSGNADKHLPASFEQDSFSALVQLSSKGEHDAIQKALVGFLSNEAARLNSKKIGLLAEKVKITAGPFDKVKKMIEALIQNLLNEANEETQAKGFCDRELGLNEITRTKLQNSIDGLMATIDETEALITENNERVTTLTKEVAELQAAMQEATELRNAEKAKNKETVKDAVAAGKAVQAATSVLKDFYAKAASATALVQQPPSFLQEPVTMGTPEWESLANPNYKGSVDKGHTKGMQTFGESYSGNTEKAGGVLAMLEVIASDFASLEKDTTAAETEAAKIYKDFTTKSEKNIAVKTKENEMLTADTADAQAHLQNAKKDLGATQDQLLAAERTYEKLKPQCVDSGVSYDERVKAREAEMQSLQEALDILSGEDFATG